MHSSIERRPRLTKHALIGSNLLHEPFTVLVALLPFIMFKDLGASCWQLSFLAALKPAVSLVSFYWGTHVAYKRKTLKSNLIISGVLARVPFLGVIFWDNPTYLIFATAIFMLFYRAGGPAWMEILKLNLPKEPRERLFSLGYMLACVEGISLSLGVGPLLDAHNETWRFLVVISAILGLLGVGLQARVPLPADLTYPEKAKAPQRTWKEILLKPWQDSLQLMRSRRDFARFQWGFMIGGSGLMFMATALPIFFVDNLALSHTNFTTGRILCMGLGVLVSSSWWGRAIGRYPLDRLMGFVILLFATLPALAMLSTTHIALFYLAFLFYGLAQGGSHNIWHLSSANFAGKEDSSLFTGVNVIMVGIRGIIFPFLGSLLCKWQGPTIVLVLGMLICLYGAYFMLSKRKAEDIQPISE